MKYHLSLLKKYISLDTTPEDIAQNLILKTCEIEDIHTRKIPKTIVIGKIEHVEKHPDADKLNICKVNCGEKGTFQIICWGSNVAPGLFVATALVGTPFPKADITIAKRTMRGVDSEGMICSKAELDINEDTDTHWIWDLQQDVEVEENDLGIPLSDKFPWLESSVFEVDSKSLTNRPDLTGHFGLAVELNAIYPDTQKKFTGIKTWIENFRNTNILEILTHTEKQLNREIKGISKSVNTYIAIGINNIQIKKSDFFSRLQLLDLGSKPINNWVDFSNIFMNTVGLPIHCFDADKIKGAIIVRDANEWEKFTDLFGGEHLLKSSDLVIADEEKVLALAGVIGGLDSGITDQTKNIIVELANFNPVAVRKTWTRLGLRTDAELRFEKNISPAFSLYSLLLFLEELKFYAKDLGSYDIGGIVSYINPDLKVIEKKLIQVSRPQIENSVFWSQQDDFETKAKSILKDLGFDIQDTIVGVPLWRWPEDITIKEDIAEEVARIWGYEKIEPLPLLSEVKAQPFSKEVEILRKVEELMIDNFKFDEIETYPWVSEAQIQQLGSDPQWLYALQNPLNPEFPLLRDQMLYNLLTISSKNSKFFDQFRIFDIGKVWKKWEKKDAQALDQRYAEEHFIEELSIGACWYEKNVWNWNKDPLLEMKSILLKLIEKLGIKWKIEFKKSDFSYFHPKKQAILLLRKWAELVEIWKLATIHPLIMKQYKLSETAQLSAFSLNLDAIKNQINQANNEKEYETLQDQIVWRDLSFVIDMQEDFWNIITTLEKMREIEAVKVFDLYQGENLGNGKKSLAVQIKIKGDGTMTTETINTIMQSAIKKVEATGASLRA